MPLRIGFDMDGTVADFAAAFHAVEERLFGPGAEGRAGEPEREEEAQELIERRAAGKDDDPESVNEERIAAARFDRRRRDAVWKAIQSTPNFWESLDPLDHEAIPRLHGLMIEHRWEVFFITQRPATEGDTVQRQTQRWLVKHGFDLPSVLVLGGSRGAAAGAMRLDYHVDDSAQNCLDVKSESRARPILVVPDSDAVTVASARKLGIGTVRSIRDALDILEQASTAQPGVLARLASLVGWR